jgi:hypothetical protein
MRIYIAEQGNLSHAHENENINIHVNRIELDAIHAALKAQLDTVTAQVEPLEDNAPIELLASMWTLHSLVHDIDKAKQLHAFYAQE